MARTAALAIEGGQVMIPLAMNGLADRAGSLTDEVLPYYKELGTDKLSPEKEAELIFKLMHANELHALLGSGFASDKNATVVDVIGLDNQHPIVIYETKSEDFRWHLKGKVKLLSQTATGGWEQVGKTVKGPLEQFGVAIAKPEAELFSVEDVNERILDVIAVASLPIAGAGNLLKAVEPTVKTLFARLRGEKTSLSEVLIDISNKSFLETSPISSKALQLGLMAAVALGPIASTLSLKDVKAFGKAVNDGLELDHGFSLTPTPDGEPPHVPRWVYLIPGGMVLWGILSACNEATQRPPAVTMTTATPTARAFTETPRPATLTPMPSATPELALTPSSGSGGAEFVPGSSADLQKLIDLKNFNPATAIDINSDQYLKVKSELQGQGANVDALEQSLKGILKPGQSLKFLYRQEGWAFLAVEGNNLLWSRNISTGQWADHPNAIRTGFSLDKIGEARPGHKLDMVILGGKPWAVEFKDGSAVRYFDTLTGEFKDFRWDKLAGSENLIGKYNWNGIWQTKVFSDGKLEVSGQEASGTTVFNRALQIVEIKGDFSFGAKFSAQGGTDGGLAFIDRDPQGLANWWEGKQLHVIVNRKLGYSGLWIGYRDFVKVPVTLLNENSIPAQVNGQDQVEVKFRPGSDEIIVTINGRQLKPVVAKGLLKNAKLIPGIIAGKQTKSTVSEFTMNVPNGGQKNAKLLEVASVVPTAAATPRPQFTPVPLPTVTKEPVKGPRLLTQAEGQNLLSNLSILGECLAPHKEGLPDLDVPGGSKYIRKGIASVDGTVITYPDGKSFDVNNVGKVVFWVFPEVYNPGSIEIIHVTNISPKLVLPYLSPGDYAGITISSNGKVSGLTVLCYYK
jgi:hypothetical protein